MVAGHTFAVPTWQNSPQGSQRLRREPWSRTAAPPLTTCVIFQILTVLTLGFLICTEDCTDHLTKLFQYGVAQVLLTQQGSNGLFITEQAKEFMYTVGKGMEKIAMPKLL